MPKKSTKDSKHNKSLLLSITIIVLVFSVGFSVYTVKTAAQPPKDRELQACRVDSDCVQVPDDCCGCENGGISKAVSKKFEGYFAEKRATECKNVACLTVYVCDKDAKPRCVNSQCVLRADKPPM